MHFNILGRSIVVLSSQRAAQDLLDRRSANYSSRPDFPVHELYAASRLARTHTRLITPNSVGWGDMLGFTKYGESFHWQRKIFQQSFSRAGSEMFQPIQQQQVHVLLKNLMRDPEHFDQHARWYAAALVMEIAYGHHVESADDPYVLLAEQVNNLITSMPDTSLVDLFPWSTCDVVVVMFITYYTLQ